MKRTIAFLLALIMAMSLMAATAMAHEPDYITEVTAVTFYVDGVPTPEIPAREVGGQIFVRMRYVAQIIGAAVEWDSCNQAILLTPAGSEATQVIPLAHIGGFNDEGYVWVPLDIAFQLVHPDAAQPQRPQRDDILPAAPAARTTDHGQMAVAFIQEINDTLYNRVPFSYRELEAAEWIAYQLAAMGHPEDAVYMQVFTIEDVASAMARFGGWDATYDAFNVFDPETRVTLEEAIEIALEVEYEMMIEFFAGMGIVEEEDILAALSEMFGIPLEELDVDELLHGLVYNHLTGFISDYGIFDPYTIFRPISQNVILTVPGQSQRKIVVTAHLDGVLNPGASDNASGVALLLEGAYRMLDADNYFTIVFAFVGAEEVGLLGAYYYLNSLTPAQRDNIVLNINADVLFEGPYFFFGAAYESSRTGGLADNEITLLIAEIAEALNAEFSTVLINAQPIANMPSDQLIFLWGGHTVVALTGLARVGSAEYADFSIRPMYAQFGGSVVHTPYDCYHIINELWPNKIGDAMWTFSLFLEELLLATFE